MSNKKSIIILGIEIIILINIYFFINSSYLEKMPECWIFQNTGIKCFACGGTRCVVNLLKGNWQEAFFSHSLFFIGILYLLVVNVLYLINLNRKRKIAIWLYPKYWYGIIFVILLIMYTIARKFMGW